ncbi:MAG: response regulator transcription factor [Verrucomicrobiota bacterium]
MNKPTRVMLVEDHAGYREVLERSLKRCENAELHSQYGTAEVALRKIQYAKRNDKADVLLLDLNLPGMSGLEAIPWFREYSPELKIIILSQSNQEESILSAITRGASGYLLKSARFHQIAGGIQTVMEGGASLDPQIAKFILAKLKALQPRGNPPEKSLSNRELEILDLLAAGLSKKEIADKLEISSTTVAYHVRHIYLKLDVINAPAAVAKGFISGILPAKTLGP